MRFHAQSCLGDPYRRKVPTVFLRTRPHAGRQDRDAGQGPPDASAFGSNTSLPIRPRTPPANVKYPNVNPLIEMTDMRERAAILQANLNIISATRRMIQRTLDILKA